MSSATSGRASAVVLTYLFLGPVLTVSLVYLPPMLRGLGMTGSEIGLLLGCQSTASLVFPLLWGYLADRTQRPLLVLRILVGSAMLALLPLFSVSAAWSITIVLSAFAIGNQAVVPILDAVVMNAFPAKSFMRLRLFYIVGAFVGVNVYGRTLATAPAIERLAVTTIIVCLGLSLVTVLFVPEPQVKGPVRPRALDALSFLVKGGLLRWLVPFTIFRISMGPIDSLLALHIGDIGLPTHVAGDAYAVGLVAQVGFMLLSNRMGWDVSTDPTRTARVGLTVVMLSTAARWWLMATVHDPFVFVAVQLIHALSGGATFVFTMSLIRELVPEHQRATGQAALLVCVQIAMLIGNWGAGVAYQHFGGATAFRIAAAVSVFAAVLIVADRRPAKAATT